MDKLAEIMEWKRKEISSRIRPVNLNELEQLGKRMKKDLTFKTLVKQLNKRWRITYKPLGVLE